MPAPPKKKKVPRPIINGRRAKVLVVDDDAFISGIYILSLERIGFDIKVVRNGLEGLEAAKADRPDIILLDLMMPKMDGFETLQRLKKDKNLKDIPVLVLSSLSQKEDTARALELGATDYLKKNETLPKQCILKVYRALKLL
jgi:CheY-like chemotaxis protein